MGLSLVVFLTLYCTNYCWQMQHWDHPSCWPSKKTFFSSFLFPFIFQQKGWASLIFSRRSKRVKREEKDSSTDTLHQPLAEEALCLLCVCVCVCRHEKASTRDFMTRILIIFNKCVRLYTILYYTCCAVLHYSPAVN